MIAAVPIGSWLLMACAFGCWIVAVGSLINLVRKHGYSVRELAQLKTSDFRWFFYGLIGFLVCMVAGILSALLQ